MVNFIMGRKFIDFIRFQRIELELYFITKKKGCELMMVQCLINNWKVNGIIICITVLSTQV